jgi:hypothetical protein
VSDFLSREIIPADSDDDILHNYDWYNEIGYRDFSALKPGVHVLFEEHSLLIDGDEPFYQRLRNIRIPDKVYKILPRGFLQIDPSDNFWIDPRDRNRRIYDANIVLVTPHGEVKFGSNPDSVNLVTSRRCIVDILPDPQGV